MKFGRVEHIDAIDFSLPEDHALTKKTLERLGDQKKEPKVHIGCPVWTDKGFVGKVYPKGTKSSDFLRQYCRQFNSIEVNSTHYNIPSLTQVAKWKQQATPGFIFCPKTPQFVSHRIELIDKITVMDEFLSNIYELKEYLGPIFIQLPPYYKPAYIQHLHDFLEVLPSDLNFALELRHEDWFNKTSIEKQVFELLTHFNATYIITDTPGRRDVLHQMITTDKVFIRFLGNNLHHTDYTRIDTWVQRLKLWIDAGINEVYFFMHQPDKHTCADLAIYMAQQFKKHTGITIKVPEIIGGQTGHHSQTSLF